MPLVGWGRGGEGGLSSSTCASTSQSVCVPVIEPGPPSPPDSVTVEEVTDSTAQLAWSRGRDNGSPIANYFIQTRTPFTVGWQRVNTGGQRANGSPRGNRLGGGEQIQGLPRESRCCCSYTVTLMTLSKPYSCPSAP